MSKSILETGGKSTLKSLTKLLVFLLVFGAVFGALSSSAAADSVRSLTIETEGDGMTYPFPREYYGDHDIFGDDGEVKVEATPDSGNVLIDWEGCYESSTEEGDEYCNVLVEEGEQRTVRAIFVDEKYADGFDLTVDVGTGSGTTDPSGTNRYDYGEEVEVTATPSDGYVFDSFRGDCSGTSCTVKMDSDKHVTADFKEADDTVDEFDLTVDVEGEGSTVPSQGVHTYYDGEQVSVEATPDSGWEFSGFEGDCSGTSCDLTMDSDKQVTAVFEETTASRSLTINAYGEGTTYPFPRTYRDDHSIFGDDGLVEIEAAPSSGHMLAEWQGCFESSVEDKTCSVLVQDGDHKTVDAYFVKEQYDLNINVNGEGTTEPEEGLHTFDYNEEVDVTATPEDGWEFVGWTGDVESSDETVTVTMDDYKDITANFEEEPDPVDENYSLTYDILCRDGSEDCGTLDLEPDKELYEEGETVTLTAEPEEGFEFYEFTGDCFQTDPVCELTMDSDKHVDVWFRSTEEDRTEYNLTMNVVGEGTTIPEEGVHTYEETTHVEISVDEPGEGYKFDRWTGDIGQADEDSENIALSMSQNRDITAHFIEADKPSVRTLEAKDITYDSATLVGELRDFGLVDEDDLAVYFIYREAGETGWIQTNTQYMDETGEFEQTVTNLNEDTEYEFKAGANWNSEEVLGDMLTFVTEEEDIDDPDDPDDTDRRDRRDTIFRDPDDEVDEPEPEDLEPTANAGYNRRGIVDEEINFHGTGSVNEGSIVEYRWDFNDDGYWDYESSRDGRTSYAYREAGTYTARFEVETDRGYTADDTVQVEIREEDEVIDDTDRFVIGNVSFDYYYDSELNMTKVDFSITNDYNTTKHLEVELTPSDRMKEVFGRLSFIPTPDEESENKVVWTELLEENESFNGSIEGEGYIESSAFRDMDVKTTWRDPDEVVGPIGYFTRTVTHPIMGLLFVIAGLFILFVDERRRKALKRKFDEKTRGERARDSQGRFKKESEARKIRRARLSGSGKKGKKSGKKSSSSKRRRKKSSKKKKSSDKKSDSSDNKGSK